MKTENPDDLKQQVEFYAHVKTCAEQRKARVEDLMQRRSANGWRNMRGQREPGWDAAKKTKMIRRLMRAGQEIEEATAALEQLRHRLEQLKPEVKRVNTVAPFVPAPATSV